jgi:chromosome segregation ATPase
MKDYPPTTYFPNKPETLSREQLESSYLELRQNYKGLQLSRGQFAGKAKRLKVELESLNQAQEQLIAKLAHEAQQKQELTSVLNDLRKVSQRQKDLVVQVREEFEAVRDDRGNLVDKFNRIMRAVYQLLHQDLGDVLKPIKSAK